jgi:threonine/homoserine/homoserine lactone efflux protein
MKVVSGAVFDIASVIAGVILGLSLGIPPGPVNAAIAAESAKRSYVGGIKIGLGAMTADFTYLVLTVIGVAVLLTGSLARDAISLIGGLILLYFAYAVLGSSFMDLRTLLNSSLSENHTNVYRIRSVWREGTGLKPVNNEDRRHRI